jgi:hypothetical protein
MDDRLRHPFRRGCGAQWETVPTARRRFEASSHVCGLFPADDAPSPVVLAAGDAVGGFGAAVDEDALGEFAARARIAFVALVVVVAGRDVAVVVGVWVAPAVLAAFLAVEGVVIRAVALPAMPPRMTPPMVAAVRPEPRPNWLPMTPPAMAPRPVPIATSASQFERP